MLIESKYPGGKATMSKITGEITADLIKYPERSHKLFVVYDPKRKLKDGSKFAADLRRKGFAQSWSSDRESFSSRDGQEPSAQEVV